jgi:uncharacterized membrane protein YeaQ/YmgE (transglycosylase-associated protein family)
VIVFLVGLLAAALVTALILLVAGGILYVLGLLLSGLVVGALGRLVVPGHDAMGLGTTLLVGIGGSFLGGFVGWFLFGGSGRFLGFLLAVAGAAFIVSLVQRPDRTRQDEMGLP